MRSRKRIVVRRRPGLAIVFGSLFLASAWVRGAHAASSPLGFLQGSPLPHMMPASPPQLGNGLPSFQPQGSEPLLPDVLIPVRSVTVVGATAFSAARLHAVTAGLAGHVVPLPKIEAVRRALVDLYRRHGYILSTVSMDVDHAGNVRFLVTEGHIVAVKLSQDIGPAGTMVLGFLDHLTEEQPVSEAGLERWLLLAQQIPGISVHAVLQADPSAPGALTLIAEVAKQSVSAVVTADNRGFQDTGPAEALTVVDLNGATAAGDQTEVSLFHTSGNTDNFGQLTESFYLGDSGLRLQLYAGAGRANPGGELREVQYQSKVDVFGGQLSYPVILRRNQALNVSLRFDGIEDKINIDGASNSFDSLRVARFITQYAWQDLWAGDTRNALNVINLEDSEGIPYFGASPGRRLSPPAGRGGETIGFWKINGSISRTQTLFSPFPDATLALLTEAGGQYTINVLPSEEEFYLGGSSFTRGYYSGEVVGDKAAYATAELQLNTGDGFTLFGHAFDLGAQFYGYYDWGETWSNLTSDQNFRINPSGAACGLV